MSRFRGCEISDIDGSLVYSVDGAALPYNGGKYRCGKCGSETDTGDDTCLGRLPGIINACCGHGNPDEAYIMFENGVVIRGFNVIETNEGYGK